MLFRSNLHFDIAEKMDSAAFYPELVNQLTEELANVVERGTSKEGEPGNNDVEVRFQTIQEKRWAVK